MTRIEEVILCWLIFASVAAGVGYHVKHVMPSYFKLRHHGKNDRAFHIKQSIQRITIWLSLWFVEVVATLALCFTTSPTAVQYLYAIRLYMQGIVALASRFALPILLLAQVELTLALAYPSHSTKGGEKKAASHPLQRASENILTRIPLLSVIRLVTYLASFPGESLTILWASYALEFGIALVLFIVSSASLVYFITAKGTSLRDAPLSLSYLHILSALRHLYDLGSAGSACYRQFWKLAPADGLYEEAGGSFFIGWSAIACAYIVYMIFSSRIDSIWFDRPTTNLLSKEALERKR